MMNATERRRIQRSDCIETNMPPPPTNAHANTMLNSFACLFHQHGELLESQSKVLAGIVSALQFANGDETTGNKSGHANSSHTNRGADIMNSRNKHYLNSRVQAAPTTASSSSSSSTPTANTSTGANSSKREKKRTASDSNSNFTHRKERQRSKIRKICKISQEKKSTSSISISNIQSNADVFVNSTINNNNRGQMKQINNNAGECDENDNNNYISSKQLNFHQTILNEQKQTQMPMQIDKKNVENNTATNTTTRRHTNYTIIKNNNNSAQHNDVQQQQQQQQPSREELHRKVNHIFNTIAETSKVTLKDFRALVEDSLQIKLDKENRKILKAYLITLIKQSMS